MYRANPIYDQLDFYYEVIKILEQLCGIDFRDPTRDLEVLKESWVVHEDARIGKVTPLKIASKTLNIPEKALEAMLAHPDLPLLISELEAYTGVNWIEQNEPMPGHWKRAIPISKWAQGADGNYPKRTILGSVASHYYPELTEDEWEVHIQNLFEAMKEAPAGSFARPIKGAGPLDPPSGTPPISRTPSPESKKVISLEDAFAEDLYKPHGGWPEFIGKILQEIEAATDTGGVNVSYLVGFIEDFTYKGVPAFAAGLTVPEKIDAARQILRRYSKSRTRKATGEKIRYLDRNMREGDVWYTIADEAKSKRWLVGPRGYQYSWRKNPQRYGGSLHEAIIQQLPFLEKKGVQLKLPPLGEGKEGVVYYDASSTILDSDFKPRYKRVIKFTLTDEEIDIAWWITNAAHPSFPLIFWTWGESWEQESWDVEKYPLLFHGEPVYVFCREAIDDCVLSSQSISVLQKISHTTEYTSFDNLSYIAMEALKKEEVPFSERHLVNEFIEFMIWCSQHGLLIADIHRKNLGQREDGTIVLRDFGHCQLF
jgi:hypothetical protein